MKKKQIKIYFSDEYSDSSIKEIASSPAQNENKNQNAQMKEDKANTKPFDKDIALPTTKNKNQNVQMVEEKTNTKPFELDNSDEEYPDGNNPFVIQDTSPFELSSSSYDYSEPTFEHKTQSNSPISSPIEKFYNQTSKKMLFDSPRHMSYTYFFNYNKVETLKGPRFHYQLTLNESPLFHTKTKNRHPSDPVRISSGKECHFSQKEYEGYLLINKKRTSFSLHSKTINGPELMTIELEQVKGPFPKNTKVIFKNFSEPIEEECNGEIENDSSNKDLILCNLKPQKEEEKGHWTLDFNGKYAIPSVKNCILVKESSNDHMISFRRISSNSCEIDARDYFPPICLFALGLSSFMGSI